MMVMLFPGWLLDSGLIYGKRKVRIERTGKETLWSWIKCIGRHTKKIDIYMGKDVAHKPENGESQKVTISWTP